MRDLISRQAAVGAVNKCNVKEVTPAYMLVDKAETMIELMMLPSVEPERKTGEWLVTESIQDGQITWLNYKCSKCGHHRDRKMNYCEVCGAKMEKKQHG